MEKISRKSFVKGALGLGAVGILAGCASSASSTAAPAPSAAAPAEKKEFTFADTVRWDAQYDVVVMGMGAAGMVAAKTAADNGAKVVIVEKCEEGKAGGNTKVCGQLFAYANGDKDAAKSYYTALAGGRDIGSSRRSLMRFPRVLPTWPTSWPMSSALTKMSTWTGPA